MAQWLYDPIASALSGTARFRLPYPQANWRDERRWNAFLVEAMELMVEAEQVFGKPAGQWGPKEDDFFLWMQRGLKVLEKMQHGK